MKYIDIHTHNTENSASISIVNFSPEEAVNTNVKGFFSTGLHPWHIDENSIEKDIKLVEEAASSDEFVAIGEAGLDKFADCNIELQKEVFIEQVKISERLKKPLIIHCVRMFNELIRIKKELSPKQEWIVHGFNSNLQIAKELIKNGLYLSFGKALLNEGSNAIKVLPEIPINTIFLETDDSDIDIGTIYNSAASVLSIEEEELGKIIENNFNKIFRRYWKKSIG